MKRRNLLGYSLLFLAGCTAGANNKNSEKSIKNNIEKLTLAITDIVGIEDLKRDYGAFSIALQEILETKVEFFPVENRTAAVPALLSGKVDMVFAGPSEYVTLSARAKAIPIIAIERKDYHSILVVRADSKIKTLAQLKGKTVAMRKLGSTSGHLAPTKMLIDAGLDPKTDFKTVMLDDKGVQNLKKGEVDAWATASDRYKNIIESEGLSEKDFVIIAKGPRLPSDIFVANNQIASSFIENVRSQMLGNQDKLIKSILTAKANQKYQGAKLVPANDADYNIIREVYQKIGQGDFLK